SCVGFLIVAFGAATPATSSVLPYTPLFRSPRRRGRHGGRDPHRDAPVAGGGRGVPGRRRGRCREPSAPLRRPAARAGGGAGAAGPAEGRAACPRGEAAGSAGAGGTAGRRGAAVGAPRQRGLSPARAVSGRQGLSGSLRSSPAR